MIRKLFYWVYGDINILDYMNITLEISCVVNAGHDVVLKDWGDALFMLVTLCANMFFRHYRSSFL